MDFRGRTTPTPPPAPQSQPVNQFNRFSKAPVGRIFQVGTVTLLFAVTLLVVALAFLLATGKNEQQHAVMKDKYQAVFLNNGQVYFGNIASIDARAIDLRNIYYLQTSNNGSTAAQPASNTNVTIVKLGCELHAPYDEMIINRDQVIFWENLKDSGQVVQAIAKYRKDNSQQTCSQQSQSSTDQAPATSTPTPTTSTTPTPAPSNKKP